MTAYLSCTNNKRLGIDQRMILSDVEIDYRKKPDLEYSCVKILLLAVKRVDDLGLVVSEVGIIPQNTEVSKTTTYM
ncbi:unnamed protein product [Schistosoma mattheei]|uniref:Uncharacterized protein n=1 Tax=Schistosoma mattheei TaxID=31246 RepID=A0AA85BZP2_9TREM|nr:unnamed protein product [Schistosoma mattheei]